MPASSLSCAPRPGVPRVVISFWLPDDSPVVGSLEPALRPSRWCSMSRSTSTLRSAFFKQKFVLRYLNISFFQPYGLRNRALRREESATSHGQNQVSSFRSKRPCRQASRSPPVSGRRVSPPIRLLTQAEPAERTGTRQGDPGGVRGNSRAGSIRQRRSRPAGSERTERFRGCPVMPYNVAGLPKGLHPGRLPISDARQALVGSGTWEIYAARSNMIPGIALLSILRLWKPDRPEWCLPGSADIAISWGRRRHECRPALSRSRISRWCRGSILGSIAKA